MESHLNRGGFFAVYFLTSKSNLSEKLSFSVQSQIPL